MTHTDDIQEPNPPPRGFGDGGESRKRNNTATILYAVVCLICFFLLDNSCSSDERNDSFCSCDYCYVLCVGCVDGWGAECTCEKLCATHDGRTQIGHFCYVRKTIACTHRQTHDSQRTQIRASPPYVRYEEKHTKITPHTLWKIHAGNGKSPDIKIQTQTKKTAQQPVVIPHYSRGFLCVCGVWTTVQRNHRD